MFNFFFSIIWDPKQFSIIFFRWFLKKKIFLHLTKQSKVSLEFFLTFSVVLYIVEVWKITINATGILSLSYTKKSLSICVKNFLLKYVKKGIKMQQSASFKIVVLQYILWVLTSITYEARGTSPTLWNKLKQYLTHLNNSIKSFFFVKKIKLQIQNFG